MTGGWSTAIGGNCVGGTVTSSGGGTADDTCAITMGSANKSLSVSFDKTSVSSDPGAFDLTLNKTGSGTGNVKLYAWRDLFNDYGETVDSDFTNGETAGLAKNWWFKLTTSPDSGSNFNSWTGCSATDTEKYTTASAGDCFITMDTDKSATVDFGSGGGSSSSVPGGGGGCSGNNLTVNVGSGTVTVVSDDSSPTLTCSNFATCSQSYSSITGLTLTETETGGESFTRWSGDDCSGTANTCALNIDSCKTVNALFGGCLCAGNSCTPCAPSSSSSSIAPSVDAVCGTANKTNGKKAPQGAELCREGTASSVSENSDGWDWTCLGLNGGNSASCHAGKLEVIIQEI